MSSNGWLVCPITYIVFLEIIDEETFYQRPTQPLYFHAKNAVQTNWRIEILSRRLFPTSKKYLMNAYFTARFTLTSILRRFTMKWSAFFGTDLPRNDTKTNSIIFSPIRVALYSMLIKQITILCPAAVNLRRYSTSLKMSGQILWNETSPFAVSKSFLYRFKCYSISQIRHTMTADAYQAEHMPNYSKQMICLVCKLACECLAEHSHSHRYAFVKRLACLTSHFRHGGHCFAHSY